MKKRLSFTYCCQNLTNFKSRDFAVLPASQRYFFHYLERSYTTTFPTLWRVKFQTGRKASIIKSSHKLKSGNYCWLCWRLLSSCTKIGRKSVTSVLKIFSTTRKSNSKSPVSIHTQDNSPTSKNSSSKNNTLTLHRNNFMTFEWAASSLATLVMPNNTLFRLSHGLLDWPCSTLCCSLTFKKFTTTSRMK
jgi:hypothetical protein